MADYIDYEDFDEMDSVEDYGVDEIVERQTSTEIQRLETYLNTNRFATPKKCPYTNIFVQGGKTYNIPYKFKIKDTIPSSKLDKFMYLLEKCRISGKKMHYAERQQFYIKGSKISEYSSMEDEFDDIYEEEEDLVDKEINRVLKGSDEDYFVSKSGIMLDFDILQKMPTRQFKETHFSEIAQIIISELAELLDWSDFDERKVELYLAYIVKPRPIKCNDPAKIKDYGECYKDGFHILIPSIKISKELKVYFRNKILQEKVLSDIMSELEILNPMSDVLDACSIRNPVLFYGNCKPKAKDIYNLDILYKINLTIKHLRCIATRSYDLDPLPMSPLPKTRGKAKPDTRLPKYKYNVIYELSLNFEAPGGLIKKYEMRCLPELETEIKVHNEHRAVSMSGEEFLDEEELKEAQKDLSILTLTDPKTHKLKKLLEIISPERVKGYEPWRNVIFALAHDNYKENKPLAIWFSQRCPEAWSKGGLAALEELWEKEAPLTDKREDKVTLGTISRWAEEDDPEKYREIIENSAFSKLLKKIGKQKGELEHFDVAEVLKDMLGNKFIYDVSDTKGRTERNRWYEFVVEGDKCKDGQVWKWRHEPEPDNLKYYIAKKMPIFCDDILRWSEKKIKDAETNKNEQKQKWYLKTKMNFLNTIKKFKNDGFQNGIIKQCRLTFRKRGFEDQLNKDPNVIGVGNGVLRVFPTVELIDYKHNIPITHYTDVHYIPYDPENPFVKELEPNIELLFAGERDAYEFTMMFLASSLDGHIKDSLFFIWLGGGGNGKTFLQEMQIKTLSHPYGITIPIQKFTQNPGKASEADSILMQLKFARYAYTDESEPGDEIKIANIKKLTGGGQLSGRDLFSFQEIFEVHCNFSFTSNYAPRINGSDHGTWRRIVVYRFKMKFTDDPDPKNKYEHKNDSKFIKLVTKNKNYQRAYLSILVKWYRVLQEKYHGKLQRVLLESPTIIRETEDYRNSQDTINRFITTRLEHDKNAKHIPIHSLASKYNEWYSAVISASRVVNSEVIDQLRESAVKKYFIHKPDGTYLTEHIIRPLNDKDNSLKEIELSVIKEAHKDTSDLPSMTDPSLASSVEGDEIDYETILDNANVPISEEEVVLSLQEKRKDNIGYESSEEADEEEFIEEEGEFIEEEGEFIEEEFIEEEGE